MRVRWPANASLPAALLWIGVAVPLASAGVIYDFTGTGLPATCVSGDCPDYSFASLNVSVTLAGPLVDNLSAQNESGSVTSWLVSGLPYGNFYGSGSVSESPAGEGPFLSLTVSTDSNGDITDYGISSDFFDGDAEMYLSTILAPDYEEITQNAILEPSVDFEIMAQSPEPSTAALGLLGGIILTRALRRRRKTSFRLQPARAAGQTQSSDHRRSPRWKKVPENKWQ